MLIHLGNEQQFEEIIKEGIVLVDFFATWCGPCKMLSPELEKLADEDKDITVIKVDVDEFNHLAATYDVRAVPTLILFKDGKAITKGMGFKPLASLKQFVNQAK